MDSQLFTDRIALGSGPLTAEISPFGAELCSLRLDGVEWLWQGDEASWPRRAPLLFPHCGRTRHSTIRIDGRPIPGQPIHGFAPQSRFAVAACSQDSLTLSLSDSEATRALFPFAFSLSVEFTLSDGALTQTIACSNRDDKPIPIAAGFHPGLAWPLPGTAAKANHVILFESDEPDPIALPDADGLMGGDRRQSPVRDRLLALDDALFSAGSAIFDRLRSRSLWYGEPGHPGLAMAFDTPFLVLWRWPGPGGADYLCIEPWAGLPDPAHFTGNLFDKPGVTRLEPGHTQTWTMRLKPGA